MFKLEYLLKNIVIIVRDVQILPDLWYVFWKLMKGLQFLIKIY